MMYVCLLASINPVVPVVTINTSKYDRNIPIWPEGDNIKQYKGVHGVTS